MSFDSRAGPEVWLMDPLSPDIFRLKFDKAVPKLVPHKPQRSVFITFLRDIGGILVPRRGI